MKYCCRHFCALPLLFALPLPAWAQIEGQLFTVPEERAYLDFLREDFLARSLEAGFNIDTPDIPEIPVTEEEVVAEEPAGPVEFTLGGIMTRRDGSRSIWLNNRSLQEQDLPSGMRVVLSGQVLALNISRDGRSYLLRPGQTLNLSTGEVLEAYQRVQAAPPPEATPAPAQATPANSTTTTPVITDDASQASPTEAVVSAAPLDSTPVNALVDAIIQLSPEQASELGNLLDARQVPPVEEAGNDEDD